MSQNLEPLWAASPCLLCGHLDARFAPETTVLAMECLDCGHYLVTDDALQMLRNRSGDAYRAKLALRRIVTQHFAEGKRFTVDRAAVQLAIANVQAELL